MIVLDASVVVEMLLGTKDAERIADRVWRSGESLHAPHLVDVEVTQVLRRYDRRGELPPHHSAEALDLLARFPMTRHAHEPLLGRIWALRENLTAYDAAYVSLAEALGATLLSRDERLAQARGIRARVELL